MFPQGFSCPVVLWILLCPTDFAYGALTLSGRSSQFRLTTLTDCFCSPKPRSARTPVWALPGSLAATSGIDFSFFSSGYLDVSVRRVPSICLWIQHMVTEVCSAGFPHSDTCGSMPICSSPQLFAAYRVFHRPLVPRHPPRALFCLTVSCLTFSRLQTSFLSCLAWHYSVFLLFSRFSLHSAV